MDDIATALHGNAECVFDDKKHVWQNFNFMDFGVDSSTRMIYKNLSTANHRKKTKIEKFGNLLEYTNRWKNLANANMTKKGKLDLS